MTLMKFAIAIPQFFADGEFDPSAFRAYFERAEALGVYDSAWTQEATLGTGPQLSPIEAMTYVSPPSKNGTTGTVRCLPVLLPVVVKRRILRPRIMAPRRPPDD